MQIIKKVLMGVAALAALAFGGAQIAGAAGGGENGKGDDGPDAPLTGTVKERAEAAAQKAVGGGTTSDAHQENEGDAVYEVKVSTGGKTYEVQLDKAFTVTHKGLDDDADEHGAGDGDGETNDG